MMSMQQRIVLEIVLVLLLVLANGVFAMSEIALVSARKPRLAQLAQRGSRRAAAALKLAESPDRFLSTAQIGITLIGIFAGAFGGATIADQISGRLELVPVWLPTASSWASGPSSSASGICRWSWASWFPSGSL